jgi:hypothetical protein
MGAAGQSSVRQYLTNTKSTCTVQRRETVHCIKQARNQGIGSRPTPNFANDGRWDENVPVVRPRSLKKIDHAPSAPLNGDNGARIE